MSRASKDPRLSRRVTMQDIADAAGVHLMTVSNALGNTRHVAPETRERVLRLARELNYIPNNSARALAAGKTKIIAVISGAINEPYYGTMVNLVESQMDADGYKLILLRRPHEVTDLINATGSVPVDGAIGIDIFHMDEKFRSHPAVPCVSISTYEQELMDSVVVDLSDQVREALEIMREQGRQRLAYLVNARHLGLPTEIRARTYLDFMRRSGRHPEIIDIGTGAELLGRERLRFYLQTNGCPDGLLCLNDELAIHAYSVLRELGYRVPEDILIVGCDGQRHMEYFETPLSTIAQPMEEAAALAWQFLLKRIADPSLPLQRTVLKGRLIVRESLRPSSRG
jgi:DNA-binding LacI/PurR family transcriptional regulator